MYVCCVLCLCLRIYHKSATREAVSVLPSVSDSSESTDLEDDDNDNCERICPSSVTCSNMLSAAAALCPFIVSDLPELTEKERTQVHR